MVLHRVTKKTEEFMEGKKTQKDIKDCCTTKLDGIEQLKTKAIELKYLKDKEECIDAWER